MVVRTAFPGCLYFPVYHFLLTQIFLDFSQAVFYTIFALPSCEISDMPRTKSSSAVSQGYSVLVLLSLGYNPPRLGPWAPMDKWAKATNYWAPQVIFTKIIFLKSFIYNNSFLNSLWNKFLFYNHLAKVIFFFSAIKVIRHLKLTSIYLFIYFLACNLIDLIVNYNWLF